MDANDFVSKVENNDGIGGFDNSADELITYNNNKNDAAEKWKMPFRFSNFSQIATNPFVVVFSDKRTNTVNITLHLTRVFEYIALKWMRLL